MDQQEQSRWRPTRRQLLWVGSIVGVVALLLLIRLGYSYSWTGFGQSKANQAVQPAKSLWDWMGLLIVPFVLAIGGYLFARSENRAAQAATEQRAQDEALQAYLDQMGQMLLDKDRPLHESKERDEVRTLARARTLTVLPRLDSSRKGTVVRFLYEAGLIVNFSGGIDPTALANPTVLDLKGADLRSVDVNNGSWMDLTGLSLGGANLREATLSHVRLHGAYLSGADLREADLRRADLNEAHMIGANLRGANLSRANLSGVSLIHPRAALNSVITSGLEGIPMEDLPPGELQRRFAVFEDLNLEETTNLALEYMAGSLEGATMPNEQKYEDWRKVPRTQSLLKRLKSVL